MNFLQYITSNIYINTAVLSWFVAQSLKVLLTLITTKKIDLERFMGNGGMPSSHSAFTVSLAVLILRIHGFSSVEFAISFVFAMVVMTDAMGVRQEAGKHAKALNDIIFEFALLPNFIKNENNQPVEVSIDKLEKLENSQDPSAENVEGEERYDVLKELLGHTPLEVFGGFILGIIIGSLMPLS